MASRMIRWEIWDESNSWHFSLNIFAEIIILLLTFQSRKLAVSWSWFCSTSTYNSGETPTPIRRVLTQVIILSLGDYSLDLSSLCEFWEDYRSLCTLMPSFLFQNVDLLDKWVCMTGFVGVLDVTK
jgi:hypothetical protein